MKDMIWNMLERTTKEEAWGDCEKMNPMILLLIDRIRGFLPRGCKVKIHAGYTSSGHNKKSEHYRGNAVDFHVVGLSFLEAESLVITYLHETRMIEKVGLGMYPDWKTPGFHLDVRGVRSSWGRVGKNYVKYQEALIHARKNF